MLENDAIIATARVYRNRDGIPCLYGDRTAFGDLVRPLIIETPCFENITTMFLNAALRVGVMSVPEGQDIVLLNENDVFALRESLLFAGAKTLYNLSSMKEVEISKMLGKDIFELSWVGNVPRLDDYIAAKTASSICSMMNVEWNGLTFDRATDLGVEVELGNADVGVVLDAMGMGIVDFEDVRELLEKELDVSVASYDILQIPIEKPAWALAMERKTEDVIALWHHLVEQASIRIAFRDGSLERRTVKERIHNIGELLNMDILLEAYAAGCPAEDILV